MTEKAIISELSRIVELTSSGDDRTNALNYLDDVEIHNDYDKDKILSFINKAQDYLITEDSKL